jgi:hypothetical protein
VASPIQGVSTADTAFVDFFPSGPVNELVMVTSFAEFTTIFGGLDHRSEASYQVMQYFLNGGVIADVLRVVPADDNLSQASQNALEDPQGPLSLADPNSIDILAIPATANMDPGPMGATLLRALQYCARRRAFFLVDIPSSAYISNPAGMITWAESQLPNLNDSHGAVYYPRLTINDPLQNFSPKEVGSSGTIAGIYAGTDASRGVWKAPAGLQIGVSGATPVVALSDIDNGLLNPRGINCLRMFPQYGPVVWGARTLRGAATLADQFKYIPTRRLANYIENSLYAGLQWTVFEPNDSSLWSAMPAEFIILSLQLTAVSAA